MVSLFEGGALTRDPQLALLAGYEALLRRCAQMLAAARSDDWPALLEHESAYVDAVEHLGRVEAGLTLDATEQERKAELLERILEHDFEIRERLLARRDELGRLIAGVERGHAARRAYRRQLPPVLPDDGAEFIPGTP